MTDVKMKPSKRKTLDATPATAMPRFGGVKGYESVERVLTLAYDQTARGKGKERHSSNNTRPFDDQPISTIPRSKSFLTGLGGLSFQIEKKCGESDRMCERADVASRRGHHGEADMQLAAAEKEMLGVIVYAVAKYLFIEQRRNVLQTEDVDGVDGD